MKGITPENLIRHELIGLNVKIIRATNPSLKGVSGVVENESRNMLTIAGKRERILVPKDIATFRFGLPSGIQVDVHGGRLAAKPENRLKTKVRRW